MNELMNNGYVVSFFPPPVAPYPTLRFSFQRKIPVESFSRIVEILVKHNFKPISREYWKLMTA